jgi:hypothetical protein
MPYLTFEPKEAYKQMAKDLSDRLQPVQENEKTTDEKGERERKKCAWRKRGRKKTKEYQKEKKTTQEEAEGEEVDPLQTKHNIDTKLLRAYFEGGLHPRRSLDQYYYHMLDDTMARDEDQVVDRWARRKAQKLDSDKRSDTFVLMVDQLWLWVNRGKDAEFCSIFCWLTVNLDTVITSFPQTWGEVQQYDVRQRICNHLRDVGNRPPITSVYDLVAPIMRHCLNAINQFVPPKSQFPGFEFHDFLEVFEAYISDMVTEIPEVSLFHLNMC